MTIHAKLSASGSHRWMNCPGSVSAESGLPDSSSKYAELGTVLHDIAEIMLTTGSDGSEFIDKTHVVFDGTGAPYAEAEIEAGHIEQLTIYTDYVKNLGGELMVEQRVDFSDFVPDGFGTADAVVLVDGVLYVIDLKTGQGNRVDSEQNSQLMLYGLGAWAKYNLFLDFDAVKLVIVQPPLDHISEWEITVDELIEWGEDVVRPAAQKALSDDAPRVPSAKACQWCKAKNRCREFANEALKAVAEDFDGIETLKVRDPLNLADDEISAVLEKADLVENFLKTIKEEATNTIMNGGEIPRFKMVEGRSIRKWLDEERAEKLLAKKLKVAERFTKKLISPAQAEKKLGKGNPLIDDLSVKPEGKPTLVPVTDKRPALTFNTVEDDFDGIETDAA